MDDGGAHASGLTLHTNNFTIAEVNILIELLHTKYGIVANKWVKYGRPVIYVRSGSMDTLRTLVTPYMHSSFLYKLENQPEGK